MTTYLVGVDIGGTFTDCVAIDSEGTVTTAKSPSVPGQYATGMINAVVLWPPQFVPSSLVEPVLGMVFRRAFRPRSPFKIGLNNCRPPASGRNQQETMQIVAGILPDPIALDLCSDDR